MKYTSEAQEFLDKQPSRFRDVGGYECYEHPVYGDMHPIMLIDSNGNLVNSGCYDISSVIEEFGDNQWVIDRLIKAGAKTYGDAVNMLLTDKYDKELGLEGEYHILNVTYHECNKQDRNKLL